MVLEEGDMVEAVSTVISSEDNQTIIKIGTVLRVITRAPVKNTSHYVYWLGKSETTEFCFFQSEMDLYFKKVE